MTATASQPNTATSGKEFSGVVVSNKMTDTVVVAVTRYVRHPKYHKFIKRVKKYHAHAPGNSYAEGDRVTIKESRPISKTKHFVVVGGDASGASAAEA